MNRSSQEKTRRRTRKGEGRFARCEGDDYQPQNSTSAVKASSLLWKCHFVGYPPSIAKPVGVHRQQLNT
jgi:hypothetical protein